MYLHTFGQIVSGVVLQALVCGARAHAQLAQVGGGLGRPRPLQLPLLRHLYDVLCNVKFYFTQNKDTNMTIM